MEGDHSSAVATRPPPPPSSLNDDENTYTIVQTGTRQRRYATKPVSSDDDEPLIDTTAELELHSKKTKRLQKQQLRKKNRTQVRSETISFLELPQELLEEVLSHLRPSDIYTLLRINRPTRDFILRNEASVARQVIRRRYWILGKAFPLPYPLEQVDDMTRTALLNDRRQEMLNIQKKPFQHIKPIDPLSVCTCLTCVLAWNNLCLILDFAHFQQNLNMREPIPMIPRGTSPAWNQELTAQHAVVVQWAMTSPLAYAAILEKHLTTTVGTLMRVFRARLPPKRVVHHGLKDGNQPPRTPQQPRRLYRLSDADADSQTDEFLARSGPPSYEFPFHRDNYYSLQAYVPNRKWSEEEKRWKYYDGTQHEKDLAWARQWFMPTETQVEIERAVAGVEGLLRSTSAAEHEGSTSQR